MNPRILKTFFSVLTTRFITAFRQLLLLPLLIAYWGVDYYGEWLIISSIPSFLSLANLGIGTSTSIKISTLVAGGNFSKARSTERNGLLGMLATVLIILLSAVIWLWCFPLRTFGHVENPNLVLLVLLATLLIKMPSQIISGWWTGLLKPSRANDFANLNAIGELLIFAMVPMFRSNASSIVMVGFAWNVIWLIIFFLATSRMLQSMKIARLSRHKFSFKEIRSLTLVGMGHQLSPLWQAMLFQGSLMLAGTVLGPAGAALWGAMRIIIRSGNQALDLFILVVSPEFQIAIGKDDMNRVRILHGRAFSFTLGMSLIAVAGLIIIGPYIFHLWTANQMQVSQPAWTILTLSLIPASLWGLSGELLRSMNRPWFLNMVGTVSAAVGLLIMSEFSSYGITSFALGMLIFEVIMACCVLTYALRTSSDSLFQLLIRVKESLKSFNFLKIKYYCDRRIGL